MKKILMILIMTILPVISIYGSNMIVFDISNSNESATYKAKVIQNKINHNKDIHNKIKIDKVKLGDKWLLVADIQDPNIIREIHIIIKHDFPSAIIVEKDKPKSYIEKYLTDLNIKWFLLILISTIGLISTIWLLIRVYNIRKSQNELEDKQIKLMNKIIESKKND